MCRKTASITSIDFPQLTPCFQFKNSKPVRGIKNQQHFCVRGLFSSPPRSKVFLPEFSAWGIWLASPVMGN